jgi:predicted O-methyltransferase YrrM
VTARSGHSLTRPNVERAILRLRPPSPPAYLELERRAATAQRAITPLDVGRFLEALAACQPAGRILELGVGWGGATLWLARGARQATIVAVDREAEALDAARATLANTASAATVEWIVADARDAIESVSGPFDLVVIDVAAGEARRLVDLVLPRIAVGGRIAILGALRDFANAGKEVLASDEVGALERLRPYVLIHPQLATTVVPIGDGVLLGVKRRETIRELGGPY